MLYVSEVPRSAGDGRESRMNIALLIDCENAKADMIDGILSELAEKGTINIRRAYGNWKNQVGWEAKLHPFAIQPIQQLRTRRAKTRSTCAWRSMPWISCSLRSWIASRWSRATPISRRWC